MLHSALSNSDWSSAPGCTILDILDEREMSVEELAAGTGFTLDQTQRLIDGRLELSASTARRLVTVVGGSVEFWLARESDYRALAYERTPTGGLATETLFSRLPYSDMVAFGWISGTNSSHNREEDCLEFFGVSSLAQWQGRYLEAVSSAAFHKSRTYENNTAATAAWLRQGEIQTADDTVLEWQKSKLEDAIPALRKLTWFKSPELFLSKVQSILAACGAKFAVVRAPKGCRASGAVRRLDDGTPLIQLSFRYLSDDQFWFSLFHEIAHLILHYERMPIIEDDSVTEPALENEANTLASNIIVPPQHKEELFGVRHSKVALIAFARKIGVAPGLVVGQLQHANALGYGRMQHLKRRYRWK